MPESLKIFIVPAEPSIRRDFAEQEAAHTREQLARARIEPDIRVMDGRTYEDLFAECIDFAPEIIQVTRHGAPSDYAFLQSTTGASQRLSGKMLSDVASRLTERVRFLFLNSCRIYAPRQVLPSLEAGLISTYSQRSATDISQRAARAFYSGLIDLG